MSHNFYFFNSLLGPTDSRAITLGQYGGLSKAIGSEPILIRYTYRHNRRTFTGETQLEVESYRGTDANETPSAIVAIGVKEIEKSVKAISSSLQQIAEKSSS